MIFQFLFQAIVFVLAIFLAFYIPGNVILNRLKLSPFQKFVLSFLVGMVLWGWQGFILGYLSARWFSYIYLLFFLLIWFKANLKNLIKFKKIEFSLAKKKLDFILISLIIFGVLLQLTSVWFTGISTQKGLYFCCGSVQDNILQIAITSQIVKQFPPFEPGMYGTYIQNYHYWDSLVMGELVRVFHLPLIAINYQFMTVFISLFLGLSAIVFSQLLNLGKVFTRWLAFFLYLGGDFVWVLIAIFRGRDFFNMTPLESGQQFLENLPRAFAVVVLFAALSIFLVWLKKKDFRVGILLSLIFASLIGFKIYIGLFVFPGLVILALYDLIKKRYQSFFVLILTGILSLIIYLPVNSGAGGLYYAGQWRFEDFIVQGYFGKLNNLELARRVYLAHNSWLRVIEYELIYAVLFIFAIFGTKLIGLIQSKKSLSRLPKELHLLLIPGFIVSFISGSFFLQRSGGSNTFNFLVSIFILGSIYTSLVCYYWLNKKNNFIKILLILVIVFLTIPRSLNQAYKNTNSIYEKKGFLIKNEEIKAINYLSGQGDNSSLVLVDSNILMDMQSPYLSFLSNKKMFLSGQIDELEAHSIDFSDRLDVRNTIFYSGNASSVSAALLNNNIGYLYMIRKDELASTDSAHFLKTGFYNKEIKILVVDKNSAKEYLRKYEKNN